MSKDKSDLPLRLASIELRYIAADCEIPHIKTSLDRAADRLDKLRTIEIREAYHNVKEPVREAALLCVFYLKAYATMMKVFANGDPRLPSIQPSPSREFDIFYKRMWDLAVELEDYIDYRLELMRPEFQA